MLLFSDVSFELVTLSFFLFKQKFDFSLRIFTFRNMGSYI